MENFLPDEDCLSDGEWVPPEVVDRLPENDIGVITSVQSLYIHGTIAHKGTIPEAITRVTYVDTRAAMTMASSVHDDVGAVVKEQQE